MATTEHYDFWYLDPDEEISDFPNTWDFNIDNIDAAIHDAATAPVSLSRLPSLPAGKVTSGTFAQARIPDLPASQTTTGTFADARIPTSIARTADVDDETAALKQRIEELENATRTTGTRDITSLISDHLLDGQTGRLYVVRTGHTVTMTFDMLQFAAAGWVNLGYLPVGFRVEEQLHFPVFWGSNESTFDETSMCIVRSQGSLSFKKLDSGYARATMTYLTKDDWPSTLPGDPA